MEDYAVIRPWYWPTPQGYEVEWVKLMTLTAHSAYDAVRIAKQKGHASPIVCPSVKAESYRTYGANHATNH